MEFVLAYFLKGILIGLAIAMPVGPIAIILMKTTLAHGRKAGFAVGAGAACADTIYAMIGVFGVVLVLGFLEAHSVGIRIIGGSVLICMGAKNIWSHSEKDVQANVKPMGSKIIKDFVSSFFLTLTNPATIVAFIAIFAALGIKAGPGGDATEAALVVAGVFSGSLLWWLILTLSIAYFRSRVTAKLLHKINVFSGVAIILFGVAAMLSAVVK
jgi:threonine/homoserine/homoserine lactone efflux protein